MKSEKVWPKVFVVVLSYNGGELLKNCLQSLSRVSYPNFSVVVVDNASTDDSFKMVQENFPNVVVIGNAKNLGFSGGNNVGIGYASKQAAEYILLLNQDTEVEADFLEKIVATAEKDSQIGIVSPLIFLAKSQKIWFSGGKISWLTMKSTNEDFARSGKEYASEFITGCAMLVKKTVFERVGFLDENFFLYYEDTDFSYRAQQAGFSTVVNSESRIYHFETSGPAVGDKLYWLVLSGLIFFSKNATGLKKIWIGFYYSLRKLKNRIDMALRPSGNARVVQKAYYDFEKRKQ